MRSRDLPDLVAGTAPAAELTLLERRCLTFLPEPAALERIAVVITMLTAALADRAHRIDEQLTVLLEHDAFVGDLVSMFTAARSAPATDDRGIG